ncbi:MvdC/MvdD family ATP grasp protein [Haliangium sp.]|uniref:MvdC/MvdD family ATP grasp protein n=1 Tax=Haliangium sp. TaxID=2663208 RepID=UPI003D0A54B7
MSVLICTALDREASGIDRVRDAIEARGGSCIVVDTGRFPSDLALALEVSNDPAATARLGGLELGGIDAVWLRHVETGATLPDTMRADHRRAATVESAVGLLSVFECLDVMIVDPPSHSARVPAKPGQLVLARAAGLDTPQTLLSNDPEAVRAFAETVPGRLVCKMITSLVTVGAASASASGPDPGAPIPTTLVSEHDLAHLDGLRHSPMLFQEHLVKKRELRITAVGHQLFVASLDSSTSERGHVDWRLDPALTHAWQPCELPASVTQAVHALLDRLGLEFAAIDIVHTPDDRYVFLEINPVAYFGYIEQATGLAIAGALADLLLGRAQRRRR